MYSPGDWGCCSYVTVALLAAGGTEIKYFLWFLDLNPLSRKYHARPMRAVAAYSVRCQSGPSTSLVVRSRMFCGPYFRMSLLSISRRARALTVGKSTPRNGIYTRETACVFLEGSSANQFQPAIFAARIGALSAYS